MQSVTYDAPVQRLGNSPAVKVAGAMRTLDLQVGDTVRVTVAKVYEEPMVTARQHNAELAQFRAVSECLSSIIGRLAQQAVQDAVCGLELGKPTDRQDLVQNVLLSLPDAVREPLLGRCPDDIEEAVGMAIQQMVDDGMLTEDEDFNLIRQ